MQSFSTILALFTAAASAVSVSYDTGYDDGTRSMTAVSCSDGANGLITRYGYQTQSAVPSFPYIAGWQSIPGWNSPSCGQCLSVTYNGKTIYVTAVDHTDTGVNMSEEAMNDLTNGNAVQFGRVDATVTPVDFSLCKLPHAKRAAEFQA
ncbi:Cerato-platanin [Viridothelium virens]|uniref:Cerato-platanin n=1 Tax=Viridothelium virens TaxID=1048519 RepID=A0A6A6H8Y0_VIRVR|nr:Cerato-platanin [Viridothelium virens]